MTSQELASFHPRASRSNPYEGKRKMHDLGRQEPDSCKYVTAETRRRPFTTQSTLPPTSDQRPNPYHECKVRKGSLTTSQPFDEYLEKAESFGIEVPKSLSPLWRARILPPITDESLRKLDLTNILNNAELRHDINFDLRPEFHLRPDTRKPTWVEEMNSTNLYWEAVDLELLMYIWRWKTLPAKVTDTSKKLRSVLPSPREVLRSNEPPCERLTLIFRTIHSILMQVIPDTNGAGLFARLSDDVLLIQELEAGACNISGLADQIGSTLRTTCSPVRDTMVTAVVSNIQQGVETLNPHLIVMGLRMLFTVSEYMKLDDINHQIKCWRQSMMDNTIVFEQNYFARTAAESRLVVTRTWFDSAYDGLVNHPRSVTGFDKYVISFLAIFLVNIYDLPPTFKLDMRRLKDAHFDIREATYQAACHHSLVATLKRLGSTDQPPRALRDDLFSSIRCLMNYEASKRNGSGEPTSESALEIVKLAYRHRNMSCLPNINDLSFAEGAITAALDQTSRTAQSFQKSIHAALGTLIKRKVNDLRHLTPTQMLINRNTSPSTADTVIGNLEIVAAKLAHIAILHWQIWAPILYERSEEHYLHYQNDGCGTTEHMNQVDLNSQSGAVRRYEKCKMDRDEQAQRVNPTDGGKTMGQ